MNLNSHELVRLDLNNPIFQRQLFNLSKNEQRNILNTLRKLANMAWQQVYVDYGVNILTQRARLWATPGRGKSALPPEGARKVVPMFLIIEQFFLF